MLKIGKMNFADRATRDDLFNNFRSVFEAPIFGYSP